MPVFLLSKELYFPDPELSEPNGLLAVGGDLRVEHLILAYKNGIFPWYGVGEPILWWCPDPRLVLFPEELHVSRRLRRTIKQNKFRVSWDEAFVDVITLCKNTRTETWITDEMRNAYIDLYKAGYAHSIEAWEGNTLVGGLYGVKIGKVFFGESMFALKKDASKVAFVQGIDHLTKMGIRLIDCQVETEHLKNFGARLIPRQIFLTLLKKLT